MPDPKPRGVFCPSCGGVRLATVGRYRPSPGVNVRYRVCSACGTKVKTRETLVGVVPADDKPPAGRKP